MFVILFEDNLEEHFKLSYMLNFCLTIHRLA